MLPIKHIGRLLFARRLLLPTLETQPGFYALLTLLRSLLFRRTVIFILRPILPERGVMRWMKIAVHRLLAILPGVRLATIFSVDASSHLAGKVVLIQDLEYWDRAGCPPPAPTALSLRAQAAAHGRKIIISLGAFSVDKGGAMLLDIIEQPAVADNFLLVVAGRVAKELQPRLDGMARNNIFVENRVIEDDELLSLYPIADLSWCCYAPERDMSSGIFGRSMQFGVPAIVREGSVLHWQVHQFGQGLPIQWGGACIAADYLLSWAGKAEGQGSTSPSALDSGVYHNFSVETELRKLCDMLGINYHN